jgi:NAD(P)-dependent dehydrogenase (short-subunit alcohol dehydrogenase family)
VGRLSGKVAVVTGGASGIGAATVRLFSAEGAQVVVADLQVAKGEAVAVETGATFLRHDVGDPAAWQEVDDLVRDRFGRLDVMFNNAGIAASQNIEEVDFESWNRTLAVNLTGVMLGAKTAIALMKDNPGGSCGSIINTSSTAAFTGIQQDVAYTATKGAVRAMTKSIAVHGARGLNIRCNALIPGATMTGMLEPHLKDPQAAAAACAMSPLGRIADPSELAAMVLFLASDESSFCTGAEFIVDGGMLAGHPGM